MSKDPSGPPRKHLGAKLSQASSLSALRSIAEDQGIIEGGKLGSLQEADFTDASLIDVVMRSADLDRASFRGASLERVCLEKASLKQADFTDARFVEMEKWGEPDYTDTVIPDRLRYGFGVVQHAGRRLDEILRAGPFSIEELRIVQQLRNELADLASDDQDVMLIASEWGHLLSRDLFVRLLKSLKEGRRGE